MAATAKVIELKGDPKNPESAEHIITFPGGSISVCRTSDNKYWAHIAVNQKEIVEGSVVQAKIGKIETVRVDTQEGVKTIDFVGKSSPYHNGDHFAVKISTE